MVLDNLKFDEPKTRLAAKVFESFSKIKDFKGLQKGNGVLVALPGKDDTARRALRNLPYVEVDVARNLNAYKILQYKNIMFPKEALEIFK